MNLPTTLRTFLAMILALGATLPAPRAWAAAGFQDLRDQGAWAELRQGSTHYELTGPESAALVVLIHGVSGPLFVWDALVPELLKAGFRVLRYDLYGRGSSDRVPGPYDMELYLQQLESLLHELGVSESFDLIGHSMGSVIALEFTQRNPARVKRLGLIGPAGFPLQAPPAAKLIQVPILGELLIALRGHQDIMTQNRNYFSEPARFADFLDRFERQLKVPGSKEAILSTLREMPLQSYEHGFANVGRTDLEVLIVWGTDDRTFPYENHRRALELMPQARLITVQGARHLPQVEDAEVVTPAILRFLRGD